MQDDSARNTADGDTAVPDIYMRGRWIESAAAAAWAPRYMEHGFAAADLDRTLVAELREATLRALDAGGSAPELFTAANAYRSAVAMPAEWLTAPPEARAPPHANAVRTIYGGDALAALMRRTLHAALPIAEAAVGAPLAPTAWHGPRVYAPGCILIGHTDEYPMHAIGVTVTLEAGAPWAMQFLDLSAATDGVTRQIETDERTLVVYEGARVLHARMRPLTAGRYVAAYFHYAPRDFTASPAVSHPAFWLPGSPSGRPAAG